MKGDITRGTVLDEGLRMLSVDGLAGVTLGRLAAIAGLSKSGLFAHFNSKTQLQLDILNRMAELADAAVVAPALQAPAGLPRLRALISAWMGWPSRAGLPGGCPIAAALFELDDVGGDVRDHAVALERHWRELLLSLVGGAVELGHLSPATDRTQLVWELCGIYLTHHASTRFLRDPAADARAQTAVDALLARYGAPPLVVTGRMAAPDA